MKVLFVGTVAFSKRALEKLLDMKVEIVGAVTKKHSAFNSDFADLSPLCLQYGIPFLRTDDINSSDSLNRIRKLSPDIIFCFGWSQLIKKDILNIAELGAIGVHPAALPQNRGRHPLIWALALGLEQSASTFFFMDSGADSGDILSQKAFRILYEDKASTLYEKVTATALKQIEEFVPQLQQRTFSRFPQDHTKANVWRKRGIPDGKIDFRMSSRAIYNLVRALDEPYPGAHIEYKGKRITVRAVREISFGQNNIEPGKILEIKGNIFTVKTYNGAIDVCEHEFDPLPCRGEYL